jgi:hypothetical protein
MGMVIRKTITNILEIPLDILLFFIGRGLVVNAKEHPPLIEVALGDGVTYDNDSRIVVDKEVDEDKCSMYTVVTNSSLSLDGLRLTLSKDYADYKILRNHAGMTIDLVLLNQYSDTDEVILTDHTYFGATHTERKETKTLPKFYK